MAKRRRSLKCEKTGFNDWECDKNSVCMLKIMNMGKQRKCSKMVTNQG